MLIPGGSLTYYEVGQYFVAECEAHGKSCKRTRTATASARGARVAQGRPLGFLVGYLMMCRADGSIEDHYAAAAALTKAQRREARQKLKTMPGHASFLRVKGLSGQGRTLNRRCAPRPPEVCS